MGSREIKDLGDIAEEIRRRAQLLADTDGDRVVVRVPGLQRHTEPTSEDVHWSIPYGQPTAVAYIRIAARAVAAVWDVAPE